MQQLLPIHYQVTAHQNLVIHAGYHDQKMIEVTMVSNAFSTIPTTIAMTVGEMKNLLVEMAAEVAPTKELLNALSPVQYHPDATSRRDSFGIARQAILLDFDKQPDLNFIQTQLASMFYLMWTTHSHMLPEKGPRYRVYLPINQSLPVNEWKNSYGARFKCYFESLGFIEQNAVDQTAYTFGQLAFLTGINAEIGHVDLWFNDSTDTGFFDVGMLPEKIQQPPPTVSRQTDQTSQIIQNPYESMDWQPSTEEMAYLIGYLEKKDALWSIPACPTSGDHGLNRKTIAAALQSIGANYGDFCQLDTVMRKHDTHTDSRRAWADGTKVNTKSHPGILLKLLTPMERKLCGLVR